MKLKRKIRKLLLTLGVLGFGLLVCLGAYQKKANERLADRRLLDGVSFCVSVGKSHSEVRAEEPKVRTEQQEIEEFGAYLFKENWEMFKKVIWCESRWNTQAVSHTQDYGLTQINHIHQISPRWLRNWRVNLVVAYEMFKEQGLSPWNSSRRCWGK